VWLGWRSIWNAIQHRGTIALNENTPPRSCSLHKCFAEGFLTNVLNPKVAIFYLAFLPQFISPGDPVFSKSILLTGIHYTMGIAWLVAISFLLDYARGVITKTSIRHWLNGLCGMILVGIGFKLIAEKN
jgi:threonine/homoserine/homoserine lactone efflux protein